MDSAREKQKSHISTYIPHGNVQQRVPEYFIQLRIPDLAVLGTAALDEAWFTVTCPTSQTRPLPPSLVLLDTIGIKLTITRGVEHLDLDEDCRFGRYDSQVF